MGTQARVNAPISRHCRYATSRTFRSTSGGSRTRPTRRRCGHCQSGIRTTLDAATLYGDALFLLEPRRGTRDLNDPNVQRLHGVLEGVLARDIEHPGACHLYVHATESTTQPGKAAACAEHLGTAIPGASHINHMPSHTWNEIGRWSDGVEANTRAWHSDQKAAYGTGVAIYPQHNLHMLLFAASMDGQGAVSIQAGKDYHKLTGNSLYHALTLVRFGRFDEVLDVTDRPEGEVEGGLWDFAQGYAHLRQGDADFAEVYLNRVRTTAETSEAQMRFHDAERLLGTVAGILEGELRPRAGRARCRGGRLRARGRARRHTRLTTSPSRCHSRRGIGSVRYFWSSNDTPTRNRSIGTKSPTIRTTAGPSLGSRPRSRRRAAATPPSMPTWRRAGLGRTRGSGRRGFST